MLSQLSSAVQKQPIPLTRRRDSFLHSAGKGRKTHYSLSYISSLSQKQNYNYNTTCFPIPSPAMVTVKVKIPEYKSWIITMWHFGRDALVEYNGENS